MRIRATNPSGDIETSTAARTASDVITEAREKSVNEIPFTIRLTLEIFFGRARDRGSLPGFAL